MSIIQDYYTRLFNGLTHEQSIDQCDQESNDDHNTRLYHLDSFKKQRYFSITTNDVTSEDAKKFTSVPVSATINGYKNLKAGIEYKIYYCEGDKEFNVTDEGILSEEVEVDEEGQIEHALTNLEAETTYSYRIGFEYADKYYYGERKSFTTGTTSDITSGQVVDLGLSVKWAGYNVGASAPEEDGGLYGWGDPTGTCWIQNYATNNGYYENTGYCFSLYAGGNPPDDISGGEWDYARIAWGSPWRMPTHDEALELIEKCTWEIYTYKGVRGAKVTGPNGNTLFLPFAGLRLGETFQRQKEIAQFWTSTLYLGVSTRRRAYNVSVTGYNDILKCHSDYRDTPSFYYGHSIRPVRD